VPNAWITLLGCLTGALTYGLFETSMGPMFNLVRRRAPHGAGAMTRTLLRAGS
jgi:hypothetical protein